MTVNLESCVSVDIEFPKQGIRFVEKLLQRDRQRGSYVEWNDADTSREVIKIRLSCGLNIELLISDETEYSNWADAIIRAVKDSVSVQSSKERENLCGLVHLFRHKDVPEKQKRDNAATRLSVLTTTNDFAKYQHFEAVL